MRKQIMIEYNKPLNLFLCESCEQFFLSPYAYDWLNCPFCQFKKAWLIWRSEDIKVRIYQAKQTYDKPIQNKKESKKVENPKHRQMEEKAPLVH